MAFHPINCPLVHLLLQTIESDYSLTGLVSKYVGTPSLDSDTPTPAIVATIPATPVVPAAPKKKSKKAAVEPCTGRTAKGDPCRFNVKCDGLCGIHLRQRDQPAGSKKAKDGSAVPKVPKKAKKADPPKHTHTPLETDPECGLCAVQGDVVVPELTRAEFEAVEEEGASIQDRLRAILEGADADDDDEVVPSTSIPVVPEEPEVSSDPVEPEEPEKPLDTMGDLMAALPTVDEPEDAGEVDLRVKLARLIAEEDSDSEMEDDVIEQMSETPPSRAKLAKFQELLEEMEA